MPYRTHPSFKTSENQTIKVWRYFDFVKFVSLLDTKKLFFVRSDKFKDRFEGSYTEINAVTLKAQKDLPDKVKSSISSGRKNFKAFTFINSWHANDHESEAMWKLYSGQGKGLAIQSTFKKLTQSFTHETKDVYIGEVDYIDYAVDAIDEGNLFNPFLFKRKSFKHEREIRAIIADISDFSENKASLNGYYAKSDIENLIVKVFVAPGSSQWFVDLVKSTIKKYGFNFSVEQSSLDSSPIF